MNTLNSLVHRFKKIYTQPLFDELVLFLLSSFTSRSLFSPEKFIAGTENLGIQMRPFIWRDYGVWTFTWWPFGNGGTVVNVPTPFYLLMQITSSIFKGLLPVMGKAFFFILFPLAGISMYLYTYTFLKSRTGAFISALFYMYNQYFLSATISEGHFGIALGYAMIPLIFLALDKALNSPKIENILILSLIFTLFLSSTSHPVYLVAALTPLYLLSHIFSRSLERRRRTMTVLKVCTLTLIISFSFSAYWVLPELGFVRQSNSLFSVFHVIEDAYFFSYKSPLDALVIRNSIENLGGQRILYWELPFLKQLYTHGLSLLIPFLAFVAIYIRKDRLTILHILTAVLASYLALGPNGIPYDLFIWLWTHVPGYSTFRSGGRFLMVTAFSYSYLLGITVSWIHKRLSSIRWQNIQRIKGVRHTFLLVIILFLLGYSWVGSVGGYETYNWPDDYTQPFEWIRDQPGDFRVLTTPFRRQYVEYPWVSWTRDLGMESYGIHGQGVFSHGEGYSDDYSRFLNTLIESNSTSSLAPLLGLANVRYIVLEPDTSIYQKLFFTNQKDVITTPFQGTAQILENTYFSNHIFVASNSALIFDGREMLNSLNYIQGFNLHEWTLFFAAQTPSQTTDQYDALILPDTSPLDLLFMIYGREYTIRAAKYHFPSSDGAKYWIKSTNWLDEGKLVLGENTLYTSANTSIAIPLSVTQADTYDILLRIAYGPDRGNLFVRIDDQPALTLHPYANYAYGFEWIRLQPHHLTAGDHTLTLINDGTGPNDVDVVAVIQSDKLQGLSNQLNETMQKTTSRVINILEAENTFTRTPSDLWHPINRGSIASNGYVITSTNNTEADTQLVVLKPGKYQLAIRLAIGPEYGHLTLQVDDSNVFNIDCNNTAAGLMWYEVGPMDLNQGEFTLRILNDGTGRIDLDQLILYSIDEAETDITLDDCLKSFKTATVYYEQVSPVEYTVYINTTKSCYLLFSESYHSLWRASIDSEEIEPTIAYTFINGYYLTRTGEFSIKIHFTGQKYFTLGTAISIITLLIVFLYLTRSKWYRKLYSYWSHREAEETS